jgi:Ca-activated chloride channel homolog
MEGGKVVEKFGIKEKGKSLEEVILRRVSINGYICGDFVELSMSQLYENRSGSNIDAVYTFPIPDTAVLTGFEATLGGRTLKAMVEETNEAMRLYDEALGKGINTFTIEEHEDNVFQVTIGSILPNETVKIKISYMDQLILEGSSYKLILPSIIGPRHVPSHKQGDGLKEEDIFNNLEGDDNYKLYMNIFVESMTEVDFESPTHAISIEREDETLSKVTFKHKDEYLDEDFVLLLKEKNPEEASGMIYRYGDSEGEKGILYLKLLPKLKIEDEEPQNFDFLIDISRSMSGEKLEEAKNGLQLCIRNLSKEDKFNIIAFDSSIHMFSESGKVALNEENLRRATEWIDNLKSSKGANIYEALKYALAEKNEEGISTVLLFTDDEVEKEEEILQYVRENIGDNRIFPIGIDTSVNSYFINKLAEVGYGKPEFIYPGERIEDMVLRQFNRITNPQIDVLGLDWGNMKLEQTYPRTIEYLYDREPFSIFAKVSGEIGGTISIKGKVRGEDYIKKIDLDKLDLEENANLIRKVWARKRIESIEERMRTERGEIAESMKNKVIEISRESGVISSFTTFTMLETMEEPVLGMSINRIIPIQISEEAKKNMADAYFLDVPTFFYEFDVRERMAEEKVDENTAKSTLKFGRENILRILAKNQFAEGSFSNLEDMSLYSRIENTLTSLLAFTLGREDIGIYVNQINKAVGFLLATLEENENEYDQKLHTLLLLACKACLQKEILRGRVKDQVESTFDEVVELAASKKYVGVLNVINANSMDTFKTFTAAVLGITKEYSKREEEIFSRDSKNAVSELALLALSRTL